MWWISFWLLESIIKISFRKLFRKAFFSSKFFDFSWKPNHSTLRNNNNGSLARLSIDETKLDDTFPHALYHLKDFPNPCRLDRNFHSGGILVYVRDNMPSNLVKLDQKFENFEGFFTELELSKKNK